MCAERRSLVTINDAVNIIYWKCMLGPWTAKTTLAKHPI